MTILLNVVRTCPASYLQSFAGTSKPLPNSFSISDLKTKAVKAWALKNPLFYNLSPSPARPNHHAFRRWLRIPFYNTTNTYTQFTPINI